MKGYSRLALLLPLLYFCAGKSPNGAGEGTYALLYESGGQRPAAGAVVKFFESGDTAIRPFAVCTTDEKGRYSIEQVPSGKYNVLAEKNSYALFQSEVIISPQLTTLRDDTLKPSSSLRGVAAVQYPWDPRTVTIRVIGTDQLYAIYDEGGDFVLNGLAAGTWTLLMECLLPGYLPFTRTISIGVGAVDTLADTLKFFCADIPFVWGIRVSQDTLSGLVKLSWDRTSHRDFLDYVVYKASCSDVKFPDLPTFVAADTFFIDSITMPSGAATGRVPGDKHLLDSLIRLDPLNAIDSIDTIPLCFRYRVAIRNWEQSIGPTKGYAQIDFGRRATVSTFFSHIVTYPAAPDSLSSASSASINDTVTVALTAKNPTRPLSGVRWYDPLRKDTVSRSTGRQPWTNELRDTIRYAFDASDTGTGGRNRLIAVVTDAGGGRWFDTVTVRIVSDLPVASAGPDTGVFTGEAVHLHGRAIDHYSKIAGWEWKIGSGQWTRTSGPDTSFTAPLSEDSLLCSLAVVNDDGNRDTDQVIVYPSIKVQSIAAGVNHILYLKADGTLWGSGQGYSGQLGDGAQAFRNRPVLITGNVKSMCAGDDFTLLLKNDGSLWGCGDNGKGQLGDGLALPHSFPVLIMNDVRRMAAGSRHTLILKADSTLWTCGDNEFGQLGDGTRKDGNYPARIMTDVQDVSAGEFHSIILKTDGKVMTCGRNDNGQLGVDSVLAQGIDSAHIRFSLAWQTVASEGKSVFAGPHYSMVVKNDNTLWACGFNEYGQLGDGTMEDRYSLTKVTNNVRTIKAGAGYSMTIKNDNTLWACGWNYYGQWGNGTWEDRYTPSNVAADVQDAAAGPTSGLILKTDGSVWTYGIRNTGIQRIIPFMVATATQEDSQ
jgi:alpha-tubulin suppressor-like RCC1 family protein